jgi:hypothetical protein
VLYIYLSNSGQTSFLDLSLLSSAHAGENRRKERKNFVQGFNKILEGKERAIWMVHIGYNEEEKNMTWIYSLRNKTN